ncbi:hypothetical protein KM043_002755 [Ampulex compressa]|nr:hypothetical protein KM043_002755 [Ampulex compressa]
MACNQCPNFSPVANGQTKTLTAGEFRDGEFNDRSGRPTIVIGPENSTKRQFRRSVCESGRTNRGKEVGKMIVARPPLRSGVRRPHSRKHSGFRFQGGTAASFDALGSFFGLPSELREGLRC